MTRPGRLSFLLSLAALGAIFLAPPVCLSAQEKQEEKQEEKEKKKAPKVWTNEDLKRLSGRGVSVIGRTPQAPKEQPAAEKPETQQQEKNFYSDMPLAERRQWIAKYEQELAQGRQMLSDLRDRMFNSRDTEERRRLGQQVDELEAALEEVRAEIEVIRNTPPPTKPSESEKGDRAPESESPAPGEQPPASEEESPEQPPPSP